MENGILLAGVLFMIGFLLLFVGCTGPSDSGDQDTLTSEDVQQPTAEQNTPGREGMPGRQGGWGNLGVQACDGKSEGDLCTLTMRNQTIDGKCTSTQGNISCMPNNVTSGQRSNGPGGPGTQYVEACDGKTEGDPCTLAMRNQTMDGTCTNRAGNVSCMPKDGNTGRRSGSSGE